MEGELAGRIQSAVGLACVILIAFALSQDRRRIRWKPVFIGLLLELVVAVFALSAPGRIVLGELNELFIGLMGFTAQGSRFLFGNLALMNNVPVGPSPVSEATTSAMIPLVPATAPWAWAKVGAYFAFGVLPTIVFFSSLTAILYYMGLMQLVVRGIAWVMQRTMRTSGAETLATAGNIFVGQTQAPLLIEPFVKNLSQSELMVVMTGGFATISASVMAAYAGVLRSVPDVAAHLLCASVMSAPATLVIAKIMVPEPDPGSLETYGELNVRLEMSDANVIDAAARGASEGLRLTLNIMAMLLAFVALIALLNGFLGWIGALVGIETLSLEGVLGLACAPMAWLLGVPWSEAVTVGGLIGVKTVATEFIAYLELARIAESLNPRTLLIAVYALCGFANFPAIAIQIGGLSAIAPARREDAAKTGLKAMVGGALAAFTSAQFIGIVL